MFYDFICPKCNNEETIEMRITEYRPDGHFCSNCKAEMKRDPKDMVCGMSIDKTGDFYKKTSI